MFHRLDGIAIGRQRAFFIVFQMPKNWVAASELVSGRYRSGMCGSRACSVSGSFGWGLAVLFFAIVDSYLFRERAM